MTVEPTLYMWATFAIIILGVAAYASERVSMELTSVTIIAALLVFFHLFPVLGEDGVNLLPPRVLISGFAEPALIAILGLLVLGQGLIQTGVLEAPVRALLRISGGNPLPAIGLSFGAVLLLSAVLNNTPVVVIFIPIMSVLAEHLGRNVSKVMIPLSYAAILGGMTTLIGSSTNLLVAGALEDFTGQTLGFFDFTVIGGAVAGCGLIYVLFVAPRLLPDRASLAGEIVGEDGKQFIAQIEIGPDSPLAGQRPVAGMFPGLPDITVRLIQRGEAPVLPPYDQIELAVGDAIIVAATRRALTDVLAGIPDLLGSMDGDGPAGGGENGRAAPPDRSLAEVVVAPASRMIGRNLGQIGFRHQTGCIVLGVQRRSRMIRASMNEIRLEAGDVLLVIGRRADIRGLRLSRDVLLLEWSREDLPMRHHAKRAGFIFAAVVVAAATGLAPIVVASLTGAAVMVGMGCLNARQAIRAFDQRVILLIAAALAMGNALYATGGAQYLGHGLVAALDGTSVAVTLSAFFLLVALMTNILSNNATAVLFTPIAVVTANEMGVDPMPFVVAVILAANCSFATPMGYQTNLLVMGPGHYRFSDFMRAGAPLIIILWLAFSLIAPWYYGL